MRRADRLFEIIQVLRRASGPISANTIAAELETSQRTIYRDIGALIAQRVPIRGEAGVGYVLERGYDLPPLMLTTDEAEAAVLGCQWVVVHADPELARAALGLLAKIAAVVPEPLRLVMENPAVGTPTMRQDRVETVDVARLRAWSRQGRKLAIGYTDEASNTSERVVWPFMVGYVTTATVVVAWCELRNDFRLFRTDRLTAVSFLNETYPGRPAALLRRWLATIKEKQLVQ